MEQVWLQMDHASSVILTALHVHITIFVVLYVILGMGLQHYIHVYSALILFAPCAMRIIQFVKNVKMALVLIQLYALNVISIV